MISSNNENNISYDANGNVMSLRRISATVTTIADLSMSYNDNDRGNRLASVTNTGTEDTGTFTYAYDSSGNLTSDGRNSLEIQNNVLNLPMRVNQSGTMGGTMTYTYLGDGTRAAARAGVDATSYAGKRYRGSFVYDVTAGGVQSLESVAVSTGRLIALTGTNGAVSFESDGFITDHLGNVTAVVNLSASSSTSTNNAILEQNEYTPFGTKLNVSGLKTQAANRWRYAGKEEQNIAGLDLRLLDFGARYYDSFTCRWNAVDPLAHKYFGMSPYNYCGNDPVNKFDPDGRDWYMVEDSSIQWTDYKSQEEMDKNNIQGKYIGERVVIFNGSYDEKLGKGDNIYGEGAITATVDVYGSKGADDIGHYTGFTMTSNFEKFGAIADDEYDVTYNPSTGGKIPKLYAVKDRGPVDCVNGVNPSPAAYDPYSPTQKNKIYVHRTNNDGWAGDNPKTSQCVSSGCLLIGAKDWNSFYNQIGNNGFKLILKRK